MVKGRDDEACSAEQSTRRASRDETARPPATTRPTGPASTPSGPLPDLRSLPAWGIDVEEGRYLNFSATVWNAGPSPLVVDGFRQADNENLMDAYQYFFDGAGQAGRLRPGRHDGVGPARRPRALALHRLRHYRLMDKHKKLVVRSQKEAFCLANTDAVDYTVPSCELEAGEHRSAQRVW